VESVLKKAVSLQEEGSPEQVVLQRFIVLTMKPCKFCRRVRRCFEA